MNLGLSESEITQLGLSLVKAVAILVVGVVLARLVRAWILRLGTRRRIAVNLASLLGNLAQVAIVVFALVMIAPTFGVDWTALLTLIGTIGLAVSLAFQDLLKNVIAGIYILIERPFQIGDVISIEGAAVTGTVQSIELRISTLRTEDGLQVIVPNSTLFTGIVTNRSAFNLQRHQVEVTLAGSEPALGDITSKIGTVLQTIPDIRSSPAPATRVENISAQEVKLRVEFWTAPVSEAQVTAAVALALRETLPDAGVTVLS